MSMDTIDEEKDELKQSVEKPKIDPWQTLGLTDEMNRILSKQSDFSVDFMALQKVLNSFAQ